MNYLLHGKLALLMLNGCQHQPSSSIFVSSVRGAGLSGRLLAPGIFGDSYIGGHAIECLELISGSLAHNSLPAVAIVMYHPMHVT
jgi:hypothetical protein